MDAGFFRGTTSEQDSRFSDKNKKLMKAMRFEKSLAGKVDMEKVNMDIIKPWIVKRITELLSGIEDEVLIGYVFELLQESRFPDPKELQIAVTGFLNGKNARIFMGELWTHMLSAQENIGGIPADFLEKKKAEIRQRKQETERIQASLKRTQAVEADSTSSREIIEKAKVLAHKATSRRIPVKEEFRAASPEAKPIPTTTDLFATPSMRDQKHIRQSLVGYLGSPAATPVGRDKPGWYAEHEKHVEISRTSSASVLLIGDSIIQGLARYPKIWNKYFTSLKALNFGMGGDRTQNVLWRTENGEIPLNAQMIVVHCGTNNTDRDSPKDIACGVASIGMVFQESKPNAKIILTGLLPRDLQPSYRRDQVNKVNKYLKVFCKSGHIRNFFYLKPDADWVLPDGTLNTKYYFHDLLHLVEEGDEKFSKSIYDVVTKVYSGIKIEMSSDSEMSDENFALTFQRKTGRPRSFSPSPKRRRSRSASLRRFSSRSHKSPPPRRNSPRRRHSGRRSHSRSHSRSPKRRSRRYSSSRSKSPVRNKNLVELTTRQSSPSPPPTHNRSNAKTLNKEREESEEPVKIKPADEGLMKDDCSPTSYSKSEKTQNRGYRRKRSESVESEEEEPKAIIDKVKIEKPSLSPELVRRREKSPEIRRKYDGRRRPSPRQRSYSPRRNSGHRRKSPSFTPSPPAQKKRTDVRKRPERRPTDRSKSRSKSPQSREQNRRQPSSSEDSSSPDTSKRIEQKRREEEIRKRRDARAAREKERRLAERLREKHRQRQNRRAMQKKSASESEIEDTLLLRQRMLEEAERRLRASSEESEKSDNKNKKQRPTEVSDKSRNKKEESMESDKSAKRRQRRRKLEQERRKHNQDSSDEDEESDEDHRHVVVAKKSTSTGRRNLESEHHSRKPSKKYYKSESRPGDRRKHETSDEDEIEEEIERKDKRIKKEDSESDTELVRKIRQREVSEAESEESEEEFEDQRRVVIKRGNNRKQSESSPERSRHNRFSDHSDDQNDSTSDHREIKDEDEEEEEEEDEIEEKEEQRHKISDFEDEKEIITKKEVTESSPEEESSPERERRRRKSSKKEKKHKKHRKSSKSKKKKSRRRRKSTTEDEDTGGSGNVESDNERALREKALKSIKKKSRSRRDTYDDDMSED